MTLEEVKAEFAAAKIPLEPIEVGSRWLRGWRGYPPHSKSHIEIREGRTRFEIHSSAVNIGKIENINQLRRELSRVQYHWDINNREISVFSTVSLTSVDVQTIDETGLYGHAASRAYLKEEQIAFLRSMPEAKILYDWLLDDGLILD